MAKDWSQLLNEHGAVLLLYARQWAWSHAAAEDAVQDGFVRLWRSKYRNTENPLPLLFRAVKFSAIDRGRSSMRRQKREQYVYEDNESEVALFESGLDADDRRAKIEAALTKLPEEQREVVVMKIWGDLTFKEIGKSLRISQNTAASRYRYALGALRNQIGAELRDD